MADAEAPPGENEDELEPEPSSEPNSETGGGRAQVDDDAELPVSRIADIERLPDEELWLVDGFLSRGSITVLASAPKAGKTWVALSVATAVASGTSALGRFHAPVPGTVLIYPAEDDPRAIRGRIESLCLAQDLELGDLPLHVITAHTLQLDQAPHRQKLELLLERLRPKLLVLDPLVRLHSGPESYVGHIAELFGYLRVLQRRFEVAIMVTHHLAKNRSANAQPGSAMRGSGDIHAAYDHGVALERRKDGAVRLSLEHRSAPSPEPIAFRLHSASDGATSFEILEEGDDEAEAPATPARTQPAELRVLSRATGVSLRERILSLLRASPAPLSQVALRRTLKVRNERLTETLRELESRGAVENLGRMGGWSVPNPEASAGLGDD